MAKSLIYHWSRNAILVTVLSGVLVSATLVPAQEATDRPRLVLSGDDRPRGGAARQAATIHWQGVTLEDAILRLRPLFEAVVFVDRRIDPNQRVNLDIDASSAEQVVGALAAECGLSVTRLGTLIYVQPIGAGDLEANSAARSREIARLPAALRPTLLAKGRLNWPRRTEPRQLIAGLAAERGWQLADAARVPHDVWAAGELPELSVADQLAVLLFGFGLTYEVHAADRKIAIVPLPVTADAPVATPSRPATSAARPGARGTAATKQVYTLRVQEKPVRAVLRELSQRLRWSIQIDEQAIRAAGKSLDQRVSFSVENADREQLLDALLTPAGLEYRIDGQQIRILPRRYDVP